ncbi:hypothetical protein EPN90_03205 [Patescibacteria group bacterium]|nr:MAG: hypothetical protein EPN90_03205 [Patescibacteria group bacterium]
MASSAKRTRSSSATGNRQRRRRPVRRWCRPAEPRPGTRSRPATSRRRPGPRWSESGPRPARRR